jgi:hypothetical protein
MKGVLLAVSAAAMGLFLVKNATHVTLDAPPEAAAASSSSFIESRLVPHKLHKHRHLSYKRHDASGEKSTSGHVSAKTANKLQNQKMTKSGESATNGKAAPTEGRSAFPEQKKQSPASNRKTSQKRGSWRSSHSAH